jgi:anti-anti-sigma factor
MSTLSNEEVEREGKWLTASWHGDIDITNSDALEQASLSALQNSDAGLIIDLTNVAYIDSAGIRSLLTMRRLLAHRQQRLLVVVPEHSVLNKALEVGGVSAVISIHGTLSSAREDR